MNDLLEMTTTVKNVLTVSHSPERQMQFLSWGLLRDNNNRGGPVCLTLLMAFINVSQMLLISPAFQESEVQRSEKKSFWTVLILMKHSKCDILH